MVSVELDKEGGSLLGGSPDNILGDGELVVFGTSWAGEASLSWGGGNTYGFGWGSLWLLLGW